ncbi:MAG: 1-deoxy-D-xylulose-5-phosphate reductoisomerase [Planctomycetota bacterium]
MTTTKRLLILGSTGSIGVQTLDVVRHRDALANAGASPVRYEVVGMSAGRNAERLFEQAGELGVRDLALAEPGDASAPADATLRTGPDAAVRLVREVEADVVLGAMVGYAGLPATMAAIGLGRDVALANKETLVAAGGLIVDACARTGSRLLPVDSEHSGVWQALFARAPGEACDPPVGAGVDVARIVLTASGGALRTRTRDETYHATVEDALAHPTWDMGAKVTIDSASLTNKALELVEAAWLFGVGSDRLGVLVEPSSIVHAIVEFADGSSVAQMGAPDMRTPIQYALTHPARVPGCSDELDHRSLAGLELTPPDHERFPALRLGYRVIDEGGTLGAVFNAANERAVEAFLDRAIPFGRIAELVEGAMGSVGVSPLRDLDDAADADRDAREAVEAMLGAHAR